MPKATVDRKQDVRDNTAANSANRKALRQKIDALLEITNIVLAPDAGAQHLGEMERMTVFEHLMASHETYKKQGYELIAADHNSHYGRIVMAKNGDIMISVAATDQEGLATSAFRVEIAAKDVENPKLRGDLKQLPDLLARASTAERIYLDAVDILHENTEHEHTDIPSVTNPSQVKWTDQRVNILLHDIREYERVAHQAAVELIKAVGPQKATTLLSGKHLYNLIPAALREAGFDPRQLGYNDPNALAPTQAKETTVSVPSQPLEVSYKEGWGYKIENRGDVFEMRVSLNDKHPKFYKLNKTYVLTYIRAESISEAMRFKIAKAYETLIANGGVTPSWDKENPAPSAQYVLDWLNTHPDRAAPTPLPPIKGMHERSRPTMTEHIVWKNDGRPISLSRKLTCTVQFDEQDINHKRYKVEALTRDGEFKEPIYIPFNIHDESKADLEKAAGKMITYMKGIAEKHARFPNIRPDASIEEAMQKLKEAYDRARSAEVIDPTHSFAALDLGAMPQFRNGVDVSGNAHPGNAVSARNRHQQIRQA